jgi:hypothetical protein
MVNLKRLFTLGQQAGQDWRTRFALLEPPPLVPAAQ